MRTMHSPYKTIERSDSTNSQFSIFNSQFFKWAERSIKANALKWPKIESSPHFFSRFPVFDDYG